MPTTNIVKGNKSASVISQFTTCLKNTISGSVIVPNSINLGSPTGYSGYDVWQRNLQDGVSKSDLEGYPNPPCLKMEYPSMYRFRWVVKQGQRRLAVWAKQNRHYPGSQATLTIKANPQVGLGSDLSSSASSVAEWNQIGPIIFNVTAPGILWVEMRNNCFLSYNPVYFDHIIAT